MDAATLATDTVTEITANARGISMIYPSVRTVIDVGAEEGRAIRLGENGKVVDFGINDSNLLTNASQTNYLKANAVIKNSDSILFFHAHIFLPNSTSCVH